MSSTTLPPAAAAANASTLSDALAAAHISSEPSTPSPKIQEEGSTGVQTNGDKHGDDLEDGEIREEDEEDDGKVKTVFDDAAKFNV